MRRLGLCGALEQFRIRLCSGESQSQDAVSIAVRFGVCTRSIRRFFTYRSRFAMSCGYYAVDSHTHPNAIEGLGVTASDVDAPPVSE